MPRGRNSPPRNPYPLSGGLTRVTSRPRPAPSGGAGRRAPAVRARKTQPGPVSTCRLRLPLPDSAWIARFSREHPDVTVEMLSRLDLGRRRSLSEVRLHVPGPGSWADEIRALDQVEGAEVLMSGPREIRLRVVHRTSPFVPIFRELQLMRRFPFTIEAGEAAWVVVASEQRIRQLLDRLAERVPGVVIESVSHSEGTPEGKVLTPRQAELLRRAMAAGYFDVPRKITLTRLAAREEMAISSLSQALAIVERKLVEHWPSDA